MGSSKTEINLRRLLKKAPDQENQAKLKIYVATLREQLAQLIGERTPEGLPSISTSQAKEYADEIDALAARYVATLREQLAQLIGERTPEGLPSISTSQAKEYADEIDALAARINSEWQSKGQEGVSAKAESPMKLDASSQMHIEKHRNLQELLTEEMVGLAHQLKETSLMMYQSLLDTKKILDSTEQAVDRNFESINIVNERVQQIYSKIFKTSWLSWLIIFIMCGMFLLVVLLIRIT